ncbi:MAG: hypothetical protein ACQKBY_07935 [Verrucomicrobiales bacterium]
MKKLLIALTLSLTLSPALPLAAQEKAAGEEVNLAALLKKHQEGSVGLADDQDELSADVQDLIDEQTAEQVIQLLEEVEDIMGETIDRLDQQDTGGETIAAQTDIIEKIFEAAKQRQQQQQESGQQPSPQSGAMLDMMQRMMGQEPGDQPGAQPGQQPGNQGGEGMTGDSDAANESSGGPNEGETEARTVPKAAGKAGGGLPPEFQKALDAYNK